MPLLLPRFFSHPLTTLVLLSSCLAPSAICGRTPQRRLMGLHFDRFYPRLLTQAANTLPKVPIKVGRDLSELSSLETRIVFLVHDTLWRNGTGHQRAETLTMRELARAHGPDLRLLRVRTA